MRSGTVIGVPDGGMAEELAAMRVSYEQKALDEADLEATWHEQLLRWLGEAIRSGLAEPNAIVLTTTNPAGPPSTRSMLCKALDPGGVVFYTNYSSAKSRGLLATGWRRRHSRGSRCSGSLTRLEWCGGVEHVQSTAVEEAGASPARSRHCDRGAALTLATTAMRWEG